MMETRTVAPGLRRSPGLGTWTQTSIVVVLGSTVGLTTVTLPARSPSGPPMRAGRPTLMAAASFTGILARATTCEISTIETSGEPAAGHFAGIDRPVGHDAADGAVHSRVGKLHARRFRNALWRRPTWAFGASECAGRG